VPADVLDPRTNGGQTLLYYTGLRRLAKNILADVVGSYLSRERGAMRVLSELHAFPRGWPRRCPEVGRTFGRLLNEAWGLKKGLDQESTTPLIEGVLDQVARHVFGATLLGAGGAGFFCSSAAPPVTPARSGYAYPEAAEPPRPVL